VTIIDHRNTKALAPLRSEQIVVPAPFSYVRSYKRLRQVAVNHRHDTEAKQAAPAAAIATLIVLTWIGVTAWYLTFWFLMAPHRLIGRHQRKQERAELQHREVTAAIENRR
jgi:hypothetical protein